MIIISHEVDWSPEILEEFIYKAMLTSEEEWIMRTRIDGKSRVEQSMQLDISVPALDKKIEKLKYKYDIAASRSLILPPRIKKSAKKNKI